MTSISPLPTPAPPLLWQRQHISALLFGLFDLVKNLTQLIPAIAALGLSGHARYIPWAIAAYALLHILRVLLRWATTLYAVQPDALFARHGLLSRHQRHIGFDQIQDISIEQNIISRMFGVAKLSVETGAGGGEDDLGLSAIAMPKAMALRAALHQHRTATPTETHTDTQHSAASTAPTDTPDAPHSLYTLSRHHLMLSGLLSPSLGLLAALAALLGAAERIQPFGYDISDPRTWARLTADAGFGDWLRMAPITIALWLALILGLLMLLTGTLSTIFRDWDYRLTSDERALRRTRGLTTRTDVVITIDRIQSATIRASWLKHRLGWHELHLRSLAQDIGGTADGGGHQALPFARSDTVDHVLGHIHLCPPWPDVIWQRSHIASALPACAFAVLLMLAGAALFPAHTPYGAALLTTGLAIAILAVLSAQRRQHGVTGSWLLIRRGLFAPSITIIPFASVQSITISDTSLNRCWGLSTLALGIPGSSRYADDIIPAISRSHAMALRAKILNQDPSL